MCPGICLMSFKRNYFRNFSRDSSTNIYGCSLFFSSDIPSETVLGIGPRIVPRVPSENLQEKRWFSKQKILKEYLKCPGNPLVKFLKKSRGFLEEFLETSLNKIKNEILLKKPLKISLRTRVFSWVFRYFFKCSCLENHLFYFLR